MEEECSICMENIVDNKTTCKQCKYKTCTECFDKIDRCPFCGNIINIEFNNNKSEKILILFIFGVAILLVVLVSIKIIREN